MICTCRVLIEVVRKTQFGWSKDMTRGEQRRGGTENHLTRVVIGLRLAGHQVWRKYEYNVPSKTWASRLEARYSVLANQCQCRWWTRRASTRSATEFHCRQTSSILLTHSHLLDSLRTHTHTPRSLILHCVGIFDKNSILGTAFYQNRGRLD